MQHPPTSWKFAYSELSLSPLETFFLTFLECNNSGESVLEIHAMTVVDQSAVKNAVYNLRFKVAKHLKMIRRRKFRKPWFWTKPMRNVWRMKLVQRLDLWGYVYPRRVQFQGNTLVLTFELYGCKPASLCLVLNYKNLNTFDTSTSYFA
jgi:hypothetical protein